MMEDIEKTAKEIAKSCEGMLGNLNSIKDNILIPAIKTMSKADKAKFAKEAESVLNEIGEPDISGKLKNFIKDVDFS